MQGTNRITLAALAILFTNPLAVFAEEQRIPLGTGWNLISLNVNPPDLYRPDEERGPDLYLLFKQLQRENRHLLILMKDEAGRSYSPEGLNEIPYWDLTRGYRVRVSSGCELVFEGERIPADTPIELHEGENLIAYYPTYELTVIRNTFYALSSILNHVILAKDYFGHLASPRNNFSNMDAWRPGRGYLVQVDSACTLIYPPPLSAEPTPEVPDGFSLSSLYPNPFNATTTISFELSCPGSTRLAIYNSFGRQIEELLPLSNLPAGNHNLTWDAGDLPSGVYIIRLESESASTMKRAVLIR